MPRSTMHTDSKPACITMFILTLEALRCCLWVESTLVHVFQLSIHIQLTLEALWYTVHHSTPRQPTVRTQHYKVRIHSTVCAACLLAYTITPSGHHFNMADVNCHHNRAWVQHGKCMHTVVVHVRPLSLCPVHRPAVRVPAASKTSPYVAEQLCMLHA